MKEAYTQVRNYRARSLELIGICDDVIKDYQGQGFRLTIRQLYYQLVARDHIPNTVKSYDNIVVLMTNARMDGLIDWDAIEDRTRSVDERQHWTSGGHILGAVARSYHENMWDEQEYRVFAVVEKEALAGVLEPVCREYDVPLLPARGYPSATTLREFAKRRIMGTSQQIVVLHLGDHDPSGMDMSRDLSERLSLFSRESVSIDFRRLALNMDQVLDQQPPPNPAKVTDCRFEKYEQQYGDQSWELDALSPKYLHQLVETQVRDLIDWDQWDATNKRIEGVKERLAALAEQFDKDI